MSSLKSFAFSTQRQVGRGGRQGPALDARGPSPVLGGAGPVAPGPWRRRARLVEGVLVLHGPRVAPGALARPGLGGLFGAPARRLQQALRAVAAAAGAQGALGGRARGAGHRRGRRRRGGRGRGATGLRRRGGRAGGRGEAGEVVLAGRLAPAGGRWGRGAGRGPRVCNGRPRASGPSPGPSSFHATPPACRQGPAPQERVT